MVSPDMHKIHHHYRLPYTDTNFGNIFSIWDRLLGTFSYYERESIVYSDALVDAQSEIEINVEIDDAPLDNSTENSVDGSETQSIIMDNSFDKDSLAVEIDSRSSL